MSYLIKKVCFDFIRYANCWEDAAILLIGLSPNVGNKILSIGSAGDNSFSLLCSDPELVVAVDINQTQLHLIALKKLLIQYFDYEQVVSFLGFRQNGHRVAMFQQIKSKLSAETRQYWEQNIAQIEVGLIHQGKFEKYFQFFAQWILPFIHDKKTIEELLAPKSEAEQVTFYNQKWNTWRWRLLFKLFFSKYMMGKYGRDPEFLRQVQVTVGAFIFQRAEQHLKTVHAQQNFILRYNLTGSFGELLPHYLQPENFAKIKQNISKLQIFEGFAEAAIEKYGTFDRMNLSNIFEYMDVHLFKTTASALLKGICEGGRLAYWNLMVSRQISQILPDEATFLHQFSADLMQKDNGFFYGKFLIETKN
jgi:S-adenosylmethionine-diacylglycerol 3-amino-3-carboxypropyl transferase